MKFQASIFIKNFFAKIFLHKIAILLSEYRPPGRGGYTLSNSEICNIREGNFQVYCSIYLFLSPVFPAFSHIFLITWK